MKKTIKTMLAFVAGALALSACSNEELIDSNNGGAKLVTLTAYQESDDTKAAIDATDSKKIDWTKNDKINYFGGATGESMTLKTGAGTTEGTFEGSVTTGASDCVLYPYQSTATNNAGVITAEVPMTQYAVANSFDPAAALMVGVVNGSTVQFKNVMSYVKVTIPSDMTNCKQVSIKAKDAWTTVAGKVNIAASTGEWAETTAKEGQAFVRLVPSGSATKLTAGATYYIAILPQDMATGFELIFNDNDVIKVKQSTSSSVVFGRSKTKKLGDITSFSYTVSTVSEGTLTMADRNIGAAETTAYGDYFAWAALRPAYINKTTPTWYWSGGFTAANTPYYSGSSYTKYNTGDILEASDDIAAMLWGGNWRMATYSEWATNKANASVIGLPLAGGCGATNISTSTTNGFYWSATLDVDDKGRAGYLRTTGSVVYVNPNEYRYSGLPVRPVLDGTPDLSAIESANCYIVSAEGTYKFKTVQGNSSDAVGVVASVAVLWETFGNSTSVNNGDLVKNLKYQNGYITFTATDKKGNALIAAKDASGNILWSWHIWLTDAPQDVDYGAKGKMMDRNLGATSTTAGAVETYGLLYQWGRKDPFRNNAKYAGAAISHAASYSAYGTIEYSVQNPTTFISQCTYGDWHYSGDTNLWKTTKTKYDPSPAGYRVADGRFWESVSGEWDSTNKGRTINGSWYPACGNRHRDGGTYVNAGSNGFYWTVEPTSSSEGSRQAYALNLGTPDGRNANNRAWGFAVRCQKIE